MVPGLYDVIPGLDHVVVACLDHVVSRLDHVISSLYDVTHDDGLPYGDDAHVRVHGKLCSVLLEHSQLGSTGSASSLLESGLLGRSSGGGLDLGWPIAVNIAEVLFQRVLVGRLETALVAFVRLLSLVDGADVTFQSSRRERGEVALVTLVPPDIFMNRFDVVCEVNLGGASVVAPVADVVLGVGVAASPFMLQPDVGSQLAVSQEVLAACLAVNPFLGVLPPLMSFDQGSGGGGEVTKLTLEVLQGNLMYSFVVDVQQVFVDEPVAALSALVNGLLGGVHVL